MVSWYTMVLDGWVVFRDDRVAFLTYDDEHHRVAFVASDSLEEKPRAPHVGFYHFAFAYDTLKDLLDIADRLDNVGIHPTRTINHGPTISFYYSDPDQNEVELQVDRFRSPQEAARFMANPAFARNPVGILVDREDLRRRIEDGEALEAIMRRPDEAAVTDK